ncbi:MAG: RNA-directed DNA polymerase [Oscillospiraceae bacterium]|nr:RNA-directed DNA polymerase [Oscillospiraceae bacterium]
MTNSERIQARIARDKARKAQKNAELRRQYGTMERVFTQQNLFRSLLRRICNTAWKGSVQNYISHFIVKNNRAKKAALRGRLPPNAKVRTMSLYERGKRRDIHMIDIESRVVQGCACDSALTPALERTLIYDNPASIEGKGVSHARGRVLRFLQRMARKHGARFYVWLYDIQNFFGSIRFADCAAVMKPELFERDFTDYVMKLIRFYKRDTDGAETGVTLGSQVSQNMALLVPNSIDHAIKERRRLPAYLRYMDDGFGAAERKSTLWRVQETMQRLAAGKGLNIHPRKTHIVKASRGFIFLKVHYTVTESGRVLRRLTRSSAIRMRRKLRKFRRKVDAGLMRLDDVYSSLRSWLGYAEHVKSCRTRKRVLELYWRLFGGYGLKGET